MTDGEKSSVVKVLTEPRRLRDAVFCTCLQFFWFQGILPHNVFLHRSRTQANLLQMVTGLKAKVFTTKYCLYDVNVQYRRATA